MPTNSNSNTPKLLHLGCERTAPPEWTNVDGSWSAWLAQSPRIKKVLSFLHLISNPSDDRLWPTNIVLADLRKKLPFPDASFDAVYSSHTLEHLYREEAIAVLREAYRVLKPGGKCRNLVPDLHALVQDYVSRSTDPNDVDMVPGRRLILRMGMRGESQSRGGGLRRIYSNMTDFHSHKWMYDAEALQQLMEKAGFVDCQPRQYLQTDIPHIDKVELSFRADGGAIVEGVKPTTA
jgi:predicted SAM-dependent methyltransferase